VATISLPTRDRSFAPYTTGEPIVLPKGKAPKFNRIACRVLPLRWITAAKERMGLGYQLIALARKRPYAPCV